MTKGRWLWECLTILDTYLLSALAPACTAYCVRRERQRTQPQGAGPGSYPELGGGRTSE